MSNKAELDGYAEDPFFKLDKAYEHGRIVAWAGGAKLQEQLFWKLVKIIGKKINYLFKEEIDMWQDDTVWRRISGGILNEDFIAVVESDSDLFFHDGGFQICLRSPDTGDYFAYDEHGIFWIYSNDERFISCLMESGLEEKDSPLICDSGHWHVRTDDAEKRLDSFMKKLMERSKFFDREKVE